MSNVIELHPQKKVVHLPGVLSELDEPTRSIAISAKQARAAEEHGLYLLRQGAHEQGTMFLAMHLAWRLAGGEKAS